MDLISIFLRKIGGKTDRERGGERIKAVVSKGTAEKLNKKPSILYKQ